MYLQTMTARFTPIAIVLESPKEASLLNAVLRSYITNHGGETGNFAVDLLDKIKMTSQSEQEESK